MPTASRADDTDAEQAAAASPAPEPSHGSTVLRPPHERALVRRAGEGHPPREAAGAGGGWHTLRGGVAGTRYSSGGLPQRVELVTSTEVSDHGAQNADPEWPPFVVEKRYVYYLVVI